MSFGTATPAQRLKVRDTALQSYAATQPFAQTQRAPTAAELAKITPVLEAASDALLAVGIGGADPLPATQAIVKSGDSLPLKTSAGVAAGTVTATVANSAVTDVKLAATSGVVTNGQTITATGSGTTATITVTNGVVSIALS